MRRKNKRSQASPTPIDFSIDYGRDTVDSADLINPLPPEDDELFDTAPQGIDEGEAPYPQGPSEPY